VNRRKKVEGTCRLEELVENMLIVELAKAGVSQSDIRKILGVDMWRVSRIARYFTNKRR
jgi:hypothetical protein